MGDAAAKRAERRRQKILLNSEDRMKRIFGGDNYHDEHLQLVTSPAEDPSPDGLNLPAALQDIPLLNNEVSSILEQLLETSGPPGVRPAPPEKLVTNDKIQAESPRIGKNFYDSALFWACCGVLIRILLSTPYSYVVMDNALVSYAILAGALLIFIPKPPSASVSSTLEIIAKFSGLPESKIRAATKSYVLCKKIMCTFTSYFIGFVLLDIVLTVNSS